jgi:hypothetical protein
MAGPPYTRGFETTAKLTEHFVKHRALLGVGSEADYLARADAFLGAPLPKDVLECDRNSDGDRLRFRISTQEYGVLRPDGFIRTYYVCDGTSRDKRWFGSKCRK